MAFHSPQTFYWLFLLMPLVLLWHFLKLRRPEYPVASLPLWASIAEDPRANVPFQRIRRFLPLVLQMGVVLLCVTALARPVQYRPVSDAYCVILQNSASMQARQDGQTRWQIALSQIRTWLESLPESTRIFLIDAADPPHLTTHRDPASARAQLAQIRPKHTPAALEEAYRLARSLGNFPLLFFGDRVFPGVGEKTSLIEAHPIARPLANYAVTRIDRTPEGEVIVHVAAFLPENMTDILSPDVGVSLYLDGTLYETSYLTLSGSEEKTVRFQLPSVQTEQVGRIQLELEDALSLDNVAYLVLRPPQSIRVQVVGPQFNPYLKAILETAPAITPEFVPQDAYLGGGNLVIFHGVEPPSDPPHRFLQIRVPSPDQLAPAVILEGVASHPLLRGLDLNFWVGRQVRAFTTLTPPPDARPILISSHGPLAWVEENATTRSVTFAWDLYDPQTSPFPRSYGAWLLTVNALEWLYEPWVPHRSLSVGTPIEVHLPQGTQQLEVKKPDGSVRVYPSPTAETVFDETDQVGVYVFSADSQSASVAVNLFNPSESNLTLADASEVRPRSEGEAPAASRALWHWFVVAAVGLMGLEWWVAHRGE